jgi:hypothetical protein
MEVNQNFLQRLFLFFFSVKIHQMLFLAASPTNGEQFNNFVHVEFFCRNFVDANFVATTWSTGHNFRPNAHSVTSHSRGKKLVPREKKLRHLSSTHQI